MASHSGGVIHIILGRNSVVQIGRAKPVTQKKKKGQAPDHCSETVTLSG